jgi:hypothetical protein
MHSNKLCKHDQEYELSSGNNVWPCGLLGTEDPFSNVRKCDLTWLLSSFQFEQESESVFSGSVLEMGFGPIGFF